jgi:dTDP-4-amino-4,6-dideoxygalactose transaminase
MIPVTKSFLPPIEEYMAQVKRAYDNEWLTNRGQLVRELESKMTNYLELERSKIICMNNGTIPIQIALKLLAKGGEVITTPFSYVATTAAIAWENCTPVYVDIHPEYLTIDETKIEAAITEKTTCILATHVFGNPCHVEDIEHIAQKYKLNVIYDSAHCFGVNYKGKSLFEYGNISTCSFHATKLFHTGEGGAIFCKDLELFHQIYYSHNFGHNGPLDFHGLGINAKISELQAAMGLALLPYLHSILKNRMKVVNYYNGGINFDDIQKLSLRSGTSWNYSYYPIIFENEERLLIAQRRMNSYNIFPRRYFYPSLNIIGYVQGQDCPISEDIASRILCLPLYDGMEVSDIEQVINLINGN